MTISAIKLQKNFQSFKKLPGILGAFKSLYSRDYVTKEAVHQFDLQVQKGEIIGLLGPNGAGKTTLMKMFTGIIVPSGGELKVLSHTPMERDKEFRKKIALVMGQKSQLWWDIPAMDSLRLLKSYYEIDDERFNEKVKYMGELLGVTDLLHIHVRKLSLGERMKLELMASLLHDPEIIFLDEPTIGLDLVAQDNIREFIKKYHAQHNTTIILTSHYMADVQALCSRLVLIMGGKKGYDGPIHEFEKILGNEKSVSFIFKEDINPDEPIFADHKIKWDKVSKTAELLVCEENLRDVSAEVLKKYPVKDFHTEKIPIEKVMKELMTNPEILEK